MAPRSVPAKPPILVLFSGEDPVRLWEPIMAHFLVSFWPFHTRGTWEIEQAADFLEVIEASAAGDVATDHGCILTIKPPGDWAAELTGKFGIIATLRDAAKAGRVVLRASEVGVVRKWLAATLRAVRKMIAPPGRGVPSGRYPGFSSSSGRCLVLEASRAQPPLSWR